MRSIPKGTWLMLFLAALTLGGCQKSAPAPGAAATPAPKPAPVMAAVDAANSGSISGVVDFAGAAPKREPIDMTLDPACELEQKGTPLSESLIVNDGRLQNVFVYVKDGLGNLTFPAPKTPAVLDQQGCDYSPHVLGMMAGQTLQIENSDRAMHNVHAMAKINAGWNDSQMAGDAPLQHVLSAPELMIPIGCNQHPWMKMYLNVVSNPFFAVTDEHGRFSLHGLPPGEYTLVAVQEKLGAKEMKVRVAAHADTQTDFSYSANAR